MKTTLPFTLWLIASAGGLSAQPTPPTLAPVGGPDAGTPPAYIIVERGPHSRVWGRVVTQTNAAGRVTTRTNSYVELATGLHYAKDGQWIEAKEQIEVFPGGAVARQGQHQVIFANDLATAGAIDLQMPDGQRLRSHLLGLSYFDTASGKSVLIAEVTNCLGQVVPPNQVLYADAFGSDLKADVLYTYTRSGFEQNVILREQPPAPEAWGLDPKTTVLEVLTEFLSPPPPVKKVTTLDLKDVGPLRGENLNFGAMEISRGTAFLLGSAPAAKGIPVAKQWLKMEGRDFLVEQAAVAPLREALETLPKAGGASVKPMKDSVRYLVSNPRRLPPPRLAQTLTTNAMQLARSALRTPAAAPGLVLDYSAPAWSATDFTFHGDSNYFISGRVVLNGTTTIEGGAVIKYTNLTSAQIWQQGGLMVCKTGPYRPAIFTSKDDDSVGVAISGSTGSPTNYNGGTYISAGSDQTNAFKYLRFAYAGTAISQAAPLDVWHCQFVRCQSGVDAGGTQSAIKLHNVLLAECGTIASSYGSLSGEQVTVDQCGTVTNSAWTNSLLTAVTNGGSLTLEHCLLVTNRDGIYQSAGGGGYYLASGSTNRNAGTTNIEFRINNGYIA